MWRVFSIGISLYVAVVTLSFLKVVVTRNVVLF